MPFTLTAAVNSTLPGSVLLAVTGDPGVPAGIERVDGANPSQPVRNFSGTGSGLDQVIDCEAPLGRPVSYNLIGGTGALLAQSQTVTCPPLPSGRGLLRSVLKPSVDWMEVEPHDETGVEWASSTTVHVVPGSDTPVVVGEIRQRHSGVMSFVCRSIGEADRMARLLRDGTPMLLRHDPCAQLQTRDLLFYALDVSEVRWGRSGWRLVVVDYQSSRFVPGETLEPATGWNFEALAGSAASFAELTGRYRTFSDMALNIPKAG